MSGVERAEQYARDIIAKKVPANKWIKLACKRHLDDLKRAKKDKTFPYAFDAAKVERVVRFLELLPHTKGRWAAQRENIKLQPWQCFAYCLPFGWIRKDTGKRRFQDVFVFIPRKNGKSILGAGIGLYMMLADGEFGAEVYSGATTEKQAWEVFRPAKLMVERTPKLQTAFGVKANASNIHRVLDGSKFEPIIGNPGDGQSPSCAIVDEYHEHQTSDLYDTMKTGMGAREQALMLTITTAGALIGAPCYELYRDAQKMLDGAIERPDLWAMLYGIDEGDDWTSDAVLRKANPNYGVSVDGDFLLARQREAMQSSTKQAVFRTKHLNEWVGAKEAWMNMHKWRQCPDRKPLAELEGRPCFIALDLASKVDIAAMELVFPPVEGDPLCHVHGNYYVPEARVTDMEDTNAALYKAFEADGILTLTDGDVIDFEKVKDDLREAAGRFDLKEVAFDPWQAQQLANEMLAEGMPMVEVRQVVATMSEPMKEVEKLVYDKKLAHGGCKMLTWMASNVVAKIDAKDNIYPRKERNENKIDGIVALIMAMGRCMAVEPDNGSFDEFIKNPVIV